jgi:hypothetical protein
MIILIFTAYYENKEGSKRCTIKFKDQVPKDNEEASDWWVRYQFSGLVIVPEESPSGHGGSWKRIGIYTYSVKVPVTLEEVVLPFCFDSRELDEVWLK